MKMMKYALMLLAVACTVILYVGMGIAEPQPLLLYSSHAVPPPGPLLNQEGVMSWPTIIIAILTALLFCSEIQALLPMKSNGIIHFMVLAFRNLKGIPAASIGLLLLLATVMTTSACTTITAQKGDMSISRTAFGINLSVPKLRVTEKPDGSFTLQMEGATSDSAQAIEAAVMGVVAGMGKAVAP